MGAVSVVFTQSLYSQVYFRILHNCEQDKPKLYGDQLKMAMHQVLQESNFEPTWESDDLRNLKDKPDLVNWKSYVFIQLSILKQSNSNCVIERQGEQNERLFNGSRKEVSTLKPNGNCSHSCLPISIYHFIQ